MTVVVCEMAPDWAVMMTDAVPRFVGMALPYPPHPPRITEKAKVIIAAAEERRKVRGIRNVPLRRIMNPNRATAARREVDPITWNSKIPKCGTLADVVTVNVVLAAPLAGATVAGLKLHVMPAAGEQENEMLLANPPVGATVNMN